MLPIHDQNIHNHFPGCWFHSNRISKEARRTFPATLRWQNINYSFVKSNYSRRGPPVTTFTVTRSGVTNVHRFYVGIMSNLDKYPLPPHLSQVIFYAVPTIALNRCWFAYCTNLIKYQHFKSWTPWKPQGARLYCLHIPLNKISIYFMKLFKCTMGIWSQFLSFQHAQCTNWFYWTCWKAKTNYIFTRK